MRKTTKRYATQNLVSKSQEEVRQAVAIGKCPVCTRPISRNYALSGWWQCEQFGNPQFRKNPKEPACGWQGFVS